MCLIRSNRTQLKREGTNDCFTSQTSVIYSQLHFANNIDELTIIKTIVKCSNSIYVVGKEYFKVRDNLFYDAVATMYIAYFAMYWVPTSLYKVSENVYC